MVGKVWAWSAVFSAAGLLMASGCAEGTQPLAERPELSTGGEVFHILCKRVAAAAYPDELTGVRFNAPCDGGGAAPADVDPRFKAMVERREELVAALDQVFGDREVKEFAEFEKGELDTFLSNLIPFYDLPDEWIPDSTRALEKIMGELLADKPASKNVLKALARIAPRVGYRPVKQALGVVRPSLTYPRLDELTRQFLALVTDGGKANSAFTKLLTASALELAQPKEADAPAPENSTLRAALELLFATDDTLVAEGTPPLWVVRRDARGYAVPAALQAPFEDDDADGLADLAKDGTFATAKGKSIPSPFARLLNDKQGRDAAGRAVDDAESPLFDNLDANRTVLAALIREQHPLLKRDGDKSVVEKLVRGLRVVMGPSASRTEAFGSKASLKFEGPDVDQGPVFDLVHAAASLARYPETDELLAVLDELMRKHETDAAAPVFMGLRIDEISDEHPEAKLVGADGENTPHEFWDDLIDVGVRMVERDGQLEAVVRSFADPQSVAATRLIAKFMKYKDHVTYNGAPITIQSDGTFPAAEAEEMNSEVEHQLSEEVERMAPSGELGGMGDTGMNRSLFQRLLSTIHATNKVPNCNKEGGQLNVTDPILHALPLRFPDPGFIVNLLGCSSEFQGQTTYEACQFVRQPNGAETHMRAMIDLRSQVAVKDSQLLCLQDDVGIVDLGETQEENAQIHGFTLTPTPMAIARFVHVPRNKFMSDLFDPFATKHGVSVQELEPDILLALEMKQDDIVFGEQGPQSFLTAAYPLGKAFDDHEFFEETEDGEVATRGYMFAELLSTLHLHWPSRREPAFRCTVPLPEGDEGCSQSGDPAEPFYAHQSNLVSYEPLLIRAIEEENLSEILQKANTTLGSITITGVDGQQRDGIQVLSNFLKRMLTADETLTYRDGRKYSFTNTCVPMESAGMDGEPVPECVDGKGRIVPGNGVMPLYLLLDALKGIDKAFEGENAERHQPWLEARSALVDQFLAVDKDDVTNPDQPTYALRNRRAHAVTLQLIPWVRNRIKAHRDAGDLADWADGLSGRLAGVLGHPMTVAGLDLLDVLWDEQKAGDEFAALSAYLMDEAKNPTAFEGLIVALTDTLMLVDRDPDLTPIVQFASLGVAPNALEVIEKGGMPNVNESAAMTALELTKRITDLYPGPDVSPLARLLKNAVLMDDVTGQTPLEEFIDSSAEVNREDPSADREIPLTADDYRAVFEQVRAFLNDEDRGLERLYKVIQGRDLSKKAN